MRERAHRILPRHPRHVLRTACQIVRARDFRLIADRLENFSLGGLLVSPAEAVLTGEPLWVSLKFPETGDWLDTTAVVSRVVHGRRPGEWTRKLGLAFDALDDDATGVLLRNLALTPPAPPRGRAGRRATFSGWALARLAARTCETLA
ncbi:MAG TPA: PilZ domain-containing protein [Polyangiaceae bacterium]|nr:PilZ domain-containing protein [Polyangiaceae bacterium]